MSCFRFSLLRFVFGLSTGGAGSDFGQCWRRFWWPRMCRLFCLLTKQIEHNTRVGNFRFTHCTSHRQLKDNTFNKVLDQCSVQNISPCPVPRLNKQYPIPIYDPVMDYILACLVHKHELSVWSCLRVAISQTNLRVPLPVNQNFHNCCNLTKLHTNYK